MGEASTTKRQRRSADETRRIILDAAVAWIEDNGSANLKIVDIARSSLVSEVLIYRYFSDRQGVLTAALVELWNRYMSEPIEQARSMIENLPDEAFTPELLVSLRLRPNRDIERRRRWARLQVLAASPENPELARLIRETQTRINREHESLIDLIQSRMPGHHVASARIMRMLNQNVMFGFVLEDLTDDPISDDELDAFLLEFYQRMLDPN